MIGLFSDSHGNLGAFNSAYELLRAKGAKRFFFMGGRYTDLDDWLAQRGTQGSDADELRKKFVRTPEKWSPEYVDTTIERTTMDMLGDVLCCIVHDKDDLREEDMLNASVLIHGKGAEPAVAQVGQRLFLTAGRLTGAAEQTCGLIEVASKEVHFSAFTLAGETVINRQRLNVGSKTKLSLR